MAFGAICPALLPVPKLEQRHAVTPFQNFLSFPDRLDQEAARLRAQAEKLPQG
jgi:hypothetical protein